MNLSDQVAARLAEFPPEGEATDQALRDADRMADQFKDVLPKTFSVPMERFYGLPAFQKDLISG